jgi:enoyl-CoA hydratase/carnithine racemase
MLYESPHVRVEANDGIATLWLEFPGAPVNALTPPRLAALDRALSAVLAQPHVEILVIRSGRPAGFCGGHDPAYLAELTSQEEQTRFALAGQRVLGRLAETELVTLAFVEGPCRGPGLELALACDYRVAVAGPDSAFDFPDAAIGLPPCWGGTTWVKRLRKAAGLLAGQTLTAREAARAGVVDAACSARRGKIELRTFLDRLQFHPRKRRRAPLAQDFAAERITFRAALDSPRVRRALAAAAAESHSLCNSGNSFTPLPALVGLIGSNAATANLAVELALRGTSVLIAASDITLSLDEAVRRGRATPLEGEQARARIRVDADCDSLAAAGWVIAVDPAVSALEFVERHLRPHAVLTVSPDRLPHLVEHAARPERIVGLNFAAGQRVELTSHDVTDADTLATVAVWMRRLGFTPAPRTATAARAVLQAA